MRYQMDLLVATLRWALRINDLVRNQEETIKLLGKLVCQRKVRKTVCTAHPAKLTDIQMLRALWADKDGRPQTHG